MRICYLADASSIHTQRWAEYFANQGQEVHMMSYDQYSGKNSRITHHSLQPLHSLPLTLGRLPKARSAEHAFRIRNALRKGVRNLRPQVLHAHYVVGYGHLAFLSGWHPLVVTAWGSDIFNHRLEPASSRLLTRLTLRKADLMTCDSVDLKRSLVALGANPKKVHVVHHGVNTTLFSSSYNRCELLKEYGFSPDDRVVLSPRSIRSLYNTDTVVRSFARIQPSFPNCKLLLKDYFGNEEYRASVKALSRELRVEHLVTFLDQVDYDEMAKLYNLADVVVSLATVDSAPMSVVEAMACGTIVVASDLPSLREWIDDGETGFLADPKNAGEVASKLHQALLLETRTRQEWAGRNQSAIRARCDYRQQMASVQELYDKLVNGGAPFN